MSTGHADEFRDWLKANRGDATQDWLASDIEHVTKWKVDRSRYSKYESGSIPIGKQTRQHFIDYWASRGVIYGAASVAPPVGTSGEAAPQPSPDVLALIIELKAQTKAITALVAELRQAKTERETMKRRLRAVEVAVALLNREGDGSDPTPRVPEPTA